MWSLNSQPWDQESYALLTEPVRCPTPIGLLRRCIGEGHQDTASGSNLGSATSSLGELGKIPSLSIPMVLAHLFLPSHILSCCSVCGLAALSDAQLSQGGNRITQSKNQLSGAVASTRAGVLVMVVINT